MSQRQLALRAAALITASAGALAPVADLVAKRRKRRHDNDDDNDDDDGNLLLRLQRRRRRRNDDDDDEDRVGLRSNKRDKRSNDDEDRAADREPRSSNRAKRSEDNAGEDDGGAGRDAATSGQQSVLGDLDLGAIIEDRVSRVLSGGGGGGDDEPNITVSEDGENLIVLTDSIELAADASGFDVETDGISYSSGSGAGGDTDDGFAS